MADLLLIGYFLDHEGDYLTIFHGKGGWQSKWDFRSGWAGHGELEPISGVDLLEVMNDVVEDHTLYYIFEGERE